MLTQAFVSEGLLLGPSSDPPRFLTYLFSIPIGRFQLLFYAALAGPLIWVIFTHAQAKTALCILGILLGAVLAFFVLLVGTTITRLAAPEAQSPLDFWTFPSKEWTRQHPGWAWLPRALIRFLTVPARFFRMYYVFEGDTPREKRRNCEKAGAVIEPDHFLSTIVVVTLVLALLGLAYAYSPGQADANDVPAVFYLYTLIMIFIWIFGALQFHLGQLRLSPLAVLALLVLIGGSQRYPSLYSGFPDPAADDAEQRLSAVEVAESSPSKDNLVVVTTTGGGILAAGWTTYALQELISERKELEREIRLISGASGGSVGTAYYVYGRSKGQELHEVFSKSTAPALSAVAYGFAFYDVRNLLLGSFLDPPPSDRARMIEEEWNRIAQSPCNPVSQSDHKGTQEKEKECRVERIDMQASDFYRHPRLSGYRQSIKRGQLPAFILNATALESGRRVMLTPISQWEAGSKTAASLAEDQTRGYTLADYLKGQSKTDLSIWTAARLSSTFPYVTPAARYNPKGAEQVKRPFLGHTHHLIDGGYYDNYGVASALDWLDRVMKDRLREDSKLGFQKVAIVQLRSSRPKPPLENEGVGDTRAKLIGPVQGLLNIAFSEALERNRISVRRFAETWECIFSKANRPVEIETFIFQPSKDFEGPLSWQLSKAQIEEMKKAWKTRSIRKSLDGLKEFLKPSPPSPQDANPQSPASQAGTPPCKF